MKTFLFILIIITNTAFAQDSVKISGHIQDPLTDSVEVDYNNNRIAYYPQEYFAHVDKKGNFSITFPMPAGVYTEATIRHGNKFVETILQPGDSLTIKAIGKYFDSTIHYEGRGRARTNFIARHVAERGVINQYTIRIRELVYKDPADFLKSIDREKNTEYELLDKYKAGLSASFIKYWKAYYQYYNYFFIQQYPQLHEILIHRKYTDTIPEANYTVVKAMPYAFNDSFLQVPPYLLYLTGVFDIKLKAAGYGYYKEDTNKARAVEDSVNKLGYKLLPVKSAEYFTAQNIYGRARTQPLQRTEQQFNTFKQHWPASEYMPQLEQQVSTARRLAPGQPAPDIDITTQDGTRMKLSDLRGKVVYLSFWAVWCRECIGEIISERKIKPLLKKESVAFVYVSIDNDTAADNALISKYKMDGIFTHATGAWSAKEVQLYGVQSLPAYYLIDKEGKIAVQNPLTPMQPVELMVQIGSLLK